MCFMYININSNAHLLSIPQKKKFPKNWPLQFSLIENTQHGVNDEQQRLKETFV